MSSIITPIGSFSSTEVEHHEPKHDEMVENSYESEADLGGGETNIEPYIGMKFDSEESAKNFYNDYARRVGFSMRVSVNRRSQRDGAIIARRFVCSREGFREQKYLCKENRMKRPRAITREGCKALMTVKRETLGKWAVTKFVREHNHALASPSEVLQLRSHKNLTSEAKSSTDVHQRIDLVLNGIMSMTVKDSTGMNNLNLMERQCNKCSGDNWDKTLGSDTQVILDYFNCLQIENPSFILTTQVDKDQHLKAIFWADLGSRLAYHYFGDVVIFETMYKINRYQVPFAAFTGVNNHGQPVFFGGSLILDDSISSYVCLFKTWLKAMSGKHPTSIITVQDKAIQAAVDNVFPETRHRFCKWHILRESQIILCSLYSTYPNLEKEFHNCINQAETIDHFESYWRLLLEKYNLHDNEWFRSLYSFRKKWIPVYCKDTFFAEMFTTQNSRGIKSLFDGYIDGETTPQLFAKQYEAALDNCFNKEAEADFDSLHSSPSLKSPSPMEKQVAEVYTKEIFEKFQEELVETFAYTANKIVDNVKVCKYSVAKFEESHKSCMVTFDISNTIAHCSCKLFEFSGIVCRHVLTVFRVTNVLTLPSHYILNRWTRNVKSSNTLDTQCSKFPVSCQESMTLRYNALVREAIKCANEGASSVEMYNAASFVIHEALEKIISIKRGGAVDRKWAVATGTYLDNSVRRMSSSGSKQSLPIQSQQDVAISHFNSKSHDHVKPTVPDLNLLRVANIPQQNDDGFHYKQAIVDPVNPMNGVKHNLVSPDIWSVVNLKLKDHAEAQLAGTDVRFQVSRNTLRETFNSMAYVHKQLSAPTNRVAVISCKLSGDSKAFGRETDLNFQISKETLGAMLESISYINEKLAQDFKHERDLGDTTSNK